MKRRRRRWRRRRRRRPGQEPYPVNLFSAVFSPARGALPTKKLDASNLYDLVLVATGVPSGCGRARPSLPKELGITSLRSRRMYRASCGAKKTLPAGHGVEKPVCTTQWPVRAAHTFHFLLSHAPELRAAAAAERVSRQKVIPELDTGGTPSPSATGSLRQSPLPRSLGSSCEPPGGVSPPARPATFRQSYAGAP